MHIFAKITHIKAISTKFQKILNKIEINVDKKVANC